MDISGSEDVYSSECGVHSVHSSVQVQDSAIDSAQASVQDSDVNNAVTSAMNYSDNADSVCDVHSDEFCKYILIHDAVRSSGQYNFEYARIPIHSSINVQFWKDHLAGYDDEVITEFLEFG